MSVSNTENLHRLDMILYGRPAGRNIIGFAIDEIERLRADLEEKECAMHSRIRREYDATVIECWRRDNERLRAENAALVRAASDASHLLEQARIWNGRGWHWNRLHATVALAAWEKLREAIDNAALRGEG